MMRHEICDAVFINWGEPNKVLFIRGTFIFTLAENKGRAGGPGGI